MRVTECIEGCYETQETPFGKVYVWLSGAPRSCGERLAPPFERRRLPGGRETRNFTPGATPGIARSRDTHRESFLTRSIEHNRGSLSTHEHRAECETPSYGEERTRRWVGVFIAAVGVALMALSLALESGPL